MLTIYIPKDENKLDFVCNILDTLLTTCKEFTFFNCTESPIDEYDYFSYNGRKCRKMEQGQSIERINKTRYLQSYVVDGLDKQGYTLRDYIDACRLFELETINVAYGNFNQPRCTGLESSNIVATIAVCPDGLNEIHISGDLEFLTLVHNLINN